MSRGEDFNPVGRSALFGFGDVSSLTKTLRRVKTCCGVNGV